MTKATRFFGFTPSADQFFLSLFKRFQLVPNSFPMKYFLQFPSPAEQLIAVRIHTLATRPSTRFQLPAWRPGRYELQNYAQFVSDVAATDERGQSLPVLKTDVRTWEVQAEAGTPIHFTYHYYANQPDAGGSFVDVDGIYVNGINLFMRCPDQAEEACWLHLDLPADYQLAIALEKSGDAYRARDFHELVDSPFLAGPDLQHHAFRVRGLHTHLWFQGVCQPDFPRLETDIRAYTEAQLALFGDCPVDEYHYFFRMLPYPYRHGVEHQNSTVIVMGPGIELMKPEMYKSFLEICSHELFHTWNVKYLRPADMQPYDYQAENYSRLHYVTEGITTYYGDLMLWKGGGWSMENWVNSINGELQRHYRKGGKDFISLEEASFNSWADGYDKPGTPNRKISFYTKGYLVAMLLDFSIRRATHDEQSLDDVMFWLYQQLAKTGRGYTAEDVQGCVERVCGKNMEAFFEAYIRGVTDLEPLLREMGDYYGLVLHHQARGGLSEALLGLRIKTTPEGSFVAKLFPNSPALRAGLSLGDQLVSLNDLKVGQAFDSLITYHRDVDAWEVHYFHEGRLKQCTIQRDPDYALYVPQFGLAIDPTPEQRSRRNAWRSITTASNAQPSSRTGN